MATTEPADLVDRPVSSPAAQPATRRRRRSGASVATGMMGIGLLAGPANVIMQLARPGVGYGVAESRVESGRIDKHPIGTTLQVPPEMWPKDRAAFDEYWQKSLEQVHIDDTVRDFRYPIAANRVAMPLPRRIRRPLEQVALLITTGFLPQRFRDEMRLPWDACRQRRFDRLMGAIRVLNNLAPKFVQQFPFNVLLVDLDWRIRTGRPLV